MTELCKYFSCDLNTLIYYDFFYKFYLTLILSNNFISTWLTILSYFLAIESLVKSKKYGACLGLLEIFLCSKYFEYDAHFSVWFHLIFRLVK